MSAQAMAIYTLLHLAEYKRFNNQVFDDSQKEVT
jgi:hypothetical protein